MTQKKQTAAIIITNQSKNKILLHRQIPPKLEKEEMLQKVSGHVIESQSEHLRPIFQKDFGGSYACVTRLSDYIKKASTQIIGERYRESFSLLETGIKPGESGEEAVRRVISEQINFKFPDFQPVFWRDFEYDDERISIYTITFEDQCYHGLMEELVDNKKMVSTGKLEMVHTFLLLMMIKQKRYMNSRFNEMLLEYLRSDLPLSVWCVSWECWDNKTNDLLYADFDIVMEGEGLRFLFVGRIENSHYSKDYHFKGDFQIDLEHPEPIFTLIPESISDSYQENLQGEPYRLMLEIDKIPRYGEYLEVSIWYEASYGQDCFLYLNIYNYYLKEM